MAINFDNYRLFIGCQPARFWPVRPAKIGPKFDRIKRRLIWVENLSVFSLNRTIYIRFESNEFKLVRTNKQPGEMGELFI